MDPNEQNQFNNQFNGQFNGFDNGQFGGLAGNQFGGFNNQFGGFDGNQFGGFNNGQFNDFGAPQQNFYNQPMNNFDDMNYLDDLIADENNESFANDFGMSDFQNATVTNYAIVQQKPTEEVNRNIFLGSEETTDRIAENLVEENVNAKDYKRGKNQRAEIKSIIKVYCLIIIVFAITLIGKSAYAMITNKAKQYDSVTVHALQANAEVTLTFNATNPISKVVYSWDNNGSSYIDGDGRNNFKQTVQIPYGNPVLTLRVYDCYESEHTYTKTYINTNADQTKPKIEVSAEPKMIKITATDDYGISAIMYNWKDKEPVYVAADEGETSFTTTVEISDTISDTLTITAIDVNNNQMTINQPVSASRKPVITINPPQDKKLTINAKDEVGITNIRVVVDDRMADQPIQNLKELSSTIELTSGYHIVEVTVTNLNGLTSSVKGSITID